MDFEMIRSRLKEHGHHVIFIMSILSLTFLVAWWSVFINRSIEERRLLRMNNLELALTTFSLQLGMSGEKPPQPGQFQRDERFEIARYSPAMGQLAKPLLPLWPEWCLKVQEVTLKTIETDFKHKKIMVIGESGFLVLLILLSSIFLYQFIQLEKRSTREMEEFWGRVTHEIKTPITGVKAFLQSLKNQSLEPGQLLPYVDMALKQIEKQEQLAENILAGYGLRERSRLYKSNPGDLDLVQWMKEYFDFHIAHFTDAHISLHLQREGDLPVRGDCRLLRVILDNVVDNALKYCSPGLILTVTIFTQGKQAIIAMKDNGPGFPPGFSEKIFAAYKYLGNELAGTRHGSGMGLHIARRLAEKMGGKLNAASKGEGKGAEFQLVLNLARPQKKDPA
jgi:signal transduction histidine kinase